MIIGGLQKNTLIDYPEKIAATIFVSGCNFRCPFCHNPDLVLPERIKNQPQIPIEDILKFLEERKGFLEGVVLCGGEPTVHSDLPDFAKKIKNMGYLVKLDTNGYNPEMLKIMLNNKLLDYVAMDIKAPIETQNPKPKTQNPKPKTQNHKSKVKNKYEQVTGTKIKLENIEKSIKILKQGKVDYEFRTTVIPGLLTKEDILKIAKWLSPAKRYVLQNFQAKGETVDSKFAQVRPYPDEYLKEIQKEIKSYFDICQIR